MEQYSYANTTNKIPSEIIFFKSLIRDKTDPIKKYMFNISDLKYIMKNICKFSVSYKSFSKTSILNNKDELLNFLSQNYLSYRFNNNSNCSNYVGSSNDYKYIKEFIYLFFDYDIPVYSEHSYDEVWIYPKLEIQDFISNSLFKYNGQCTKNSVYLNEATLNKLLTIFTDFTKYEYSSLEDDEISYLFKGVNYPSLVLANIDLYEKGYIEVIEELDEIKIFLNKDNKDRYSKDNSIFSDNKDLLKYHILEFINSDCYINKKYSLEDFL